MVEEREPWEGYLRPLEDDAEWRGSTLALVESLGVCTDCGAVVPKAVAEYHRQWHERQNEVWGTISRRVSEIGGDF